MENHPREDIFSVKKNGKWVKYSTQQYLENSVLAAVFFLSLGLKKGDKIATITLNNRPEWNFIDIGMSMIGIIHVPIHLSSSYNEFIYIFNQTQAKYAFVSDSKTYQDISAALKNSSSIKQIFCFDDIEGLISWNQILDQGRKNKDQFEEKLEELKRNIQDNDPVTLLYTSGTTGTPKGVLLSQKNMVSNLIAASNLQPLGYGDKALSFLPLSHIYERTSNYQFQHSGVSIIYAESIPKVIENIQETKPEGFSAVPRVLEKIRNLYFDQGKDLTFWKKVIFDFSYQLINNYPVDHKLSAFFKLKRKMADIFVFSKLRKQLGGRIKFIGCGGAKLNPNIEKFFWTAKLPVYQGYGLTETSPLISLNTFHKKKNRIGSIGPLLPDVSVKIAEDGEILCKGPNVMIGYYQNKKETYKVIDNGGWFHTGDIGKISSDQFLYIKGRKKSIFKTSYGKYVASQMIESLFRESQLISQVIVVGEGEKFAGALIQPNFIYLVNRLKLYNELKSKNTKGLVEHPKVRNLFQKEVDTLNKTLSKHEQIKKFYLISDEWSVQSGELSQSLKLRRFFIHDKYKNIIQSLYVE